MKKLHVFSLCMILSSASFFFQSCEQSACNSTASEAKHQTKKKDQVKLISNEQSIQWNDISELAELQKQNPKPVIIDVYTDWCKWCKVMDQKTFTDAALIEYLGDDYHMIKFNAETKSTLEFKGKKYDFVQGGRRGHHALAAELCNGRLAFPSFVVMDENMNTTQVINGFKEATAFKSLLEKKIY